MLISIALLFSLAGFVGVLFLWSIKQYKLLKLKEQVERQLIRKEHRYFNILAELGLENILTKTGQLFEQAGIPYDVENTLLVILMIFSILVAGGLFFEFGMVALLLPLIGVTILYSVLRKISESRLIKIEHELRYAMYDMASALRVNESLINAIAEATQKAKEPLKSEFKEIVNAVMRGEKENAALNNFCQRNKSLIIAGWVDTIIFARETGKDLAGTCERAAIKIRDKSKMKAQVRAQVAGSKGTMAGILAILGLFAFSLISSGLFSRIFTSEIGKLVLSYVIISYLLSSVWLYRIIDKEVNS